jgi:FixJ family two-component response regulator
LFFRAAHHASAFGKEKRIENSTIDLPSAPDIFLKIIAQCSIDFLSNDAKIKCEMCVPKKPDMRKLRILVFDDEEPILSLFKDFFSSRDYEVLAYRAPAVCPIYDHRSHSCPALSPCVDVLITDYRMPGMNGLQLLQEQIRMGCAMPIQNKAMMSGHCDDALRSEITGMGYVFFQKPLRFSAIKQWLSECRERTDLSRPLPTPRKEARRPIPRERARMFGRNESLVEGAAINVSESGLCLELKSPLAREQRVFIDSGPVCPCRPQRSAGSGNGKTARTWRA